MTLVRLMAVTEEALLYIASNMRERDAEEIFATRWDGDPLSLTSDCMACLERPRSVAVMAMYDHRPAAVMGAVEVWPHVWDVWCFGTDDFDHVALSLTKYVRRTLIPYLLKNGMKRAHCRSMAKHSKAHDWLRAMGAEQDNERPMKAWGKNGEDFVLFEWHREALLELYAEGAI